MLTVDKKNMCSLCFTPLPHKAKECRFCTNIGNLKKHPTALREGTILVGRYYVGRVLGKGGFGITYLCYDLKENKKVAVKEYLPDSLAHRNSGETKVSGFGGGKEEHFKNGAKKFYDEAKIMSKFNGNPNVINVSEFFYENNTAYFVMEYLDGNDFKRYLASHEGKICEGEALYITGKILEALMIVHSAGVLHRDISPDNIYLCADGSVKLIDFGAARQVVTEASNSLSVILKQGFAPFEQYQRKGKQGPWTDIYALGATLYYALTGRVIDDAMSRLDDDALDSDGISPGLFEVIKKMLAVRFADRYQNAIEVISAISDLGIGTITPEIKSNESVNFCTMCGKQIPTDQTACEECTKSRKNTKDLKTGGTSGKTVPAQSGDEVGKTEDKERKKKIILISSIGGAIAVCLAAILFVTFSGNFFGGLRRDNSEKPAMTDLPSSSDATGDEREEESIDAEKENLSALLNEAKRKYNEIISDESIDHSKCENEEKALNEAIGEYELKIALVTDKTSLDAAGEYYNSVVGPRISALDSAYKKAVSEKEAANKENNKKSGENNKPDNSSGKNSKTGNNKPESPSVSDVQEVKKCPDCGSTSHTTHPTCPDCGSKEHTVHPAPPAPTCPVCGSKYHTEHPKSSSDITDPKIR